MVWGWTSGIESFSSDDDFNSDDDIYRDTILGISGNKQVYSFSLHLFISGYAH
jgi:hypothetical protein